MKMQHPVTKGVAETTNEAFLYWKQLGWGEAPDDAELTADIAARSENPNHLTGVVDPGAEGEAKAKDAAALRGIAPDLPASPLSRPPAPKPEGV